MTLTSILPVAAGLSLLVFLLYTARASSANRKNGWIFPAILSVLFLIYSIITGVAEGPTGFWVEHTRNLWGNQIWFDLLLAAGIAWFLIVPQARALGMRLLPWALLVLATGSIGFTAMVARMLYLRERSSGA